MAGQPPQVDGDCGRGCDETGDEGFKPVTHLFVTHPVELIHLSYRRESGSAGEDADSKLVGTRVHPFWSVDRASWVDMGELREGERLWLLDGSFATVIRVQVEHAPCADPAWKPGMPAKGTLGTQADPQTGTFTTYNFEVADWHTYFAAPVGSTSTHCAIWVHNLNVRICSGGRQAIRDYIRDQAKHGRVVDRRTAIRELGFEKHHAIPEFLGGHHKQLTHGLPKQLHNEYHSLLRQELRKQGLPLNVGGKGGGTPQWFQHFQQNAGAQQKALDAVLDAARRLDVKHGTDVVGTFWRNITAGNFTPTP